MRVQRVVMPVTGTESWTVLGDDGCVVAPVERYLAYLAALERSPNTQRAYATSLKLWFEFLARSEVGWADVERRRRGPVRGVAAGAGRQRDRVGNAAPGGGRRRR